MVNMRKRVFGRSRADTAADGTCGGSASRRLATIFVDPGKKVLKGNKQAISFPETHAIRHAGTGGDAGAGRRSDGGCKKPPKGLFLERRNLDYSARSLELMDTLAGSARLAGTQILDMRGRCEQSDRVFTRSTTDSCHGLPLQ
jgi:hypothetical protein